MSCYLSRVENCAREMGDAQAYSNSDGQFLTYAGLWEASDVLASHLLGLNPHKLPVVVYGHKDPLMLACFFACMKSGCAFVPIDIVYPQARIDDILEQLERPLVLLTQEADRAAFAPSRQVVGRNELESLCASAPDRAVDEHDWVNGDDTMYILFTSGSTGRPKGVQMSAGAIDGFMDYFIDLMKVVPQDGSVFFNRVPYTFDVSLFDMVPGLACGAHLFAFEVAAEQSLSASFEALKRSGLTHWVSTPSFVEACLADPAFNEQLLPCLERIVLCGEVLRNAVARKLLERFPRAALLNTYGPTETQSVSDIVVDGHLIEECDPLPVGYLSPDMHALICDPQTHAFLECDQVGEIVLAGNTVAQGYYGQPDRTAAVFGSTQVSGESLRSYRTGDKGYLDAAGRLFCLGRLDFQVKVNGFRVELGDVEENLCLLDAVQQACVVGVIRDGAVAHLCAFVQLADPAAPRDFSQTRALKAACGKILPSYMVPRAFRYVDDFPLNANGKIDRKALQDLAGGRS